VALQLIVLQTFANNAVLARQGLHAWLQMFAAAWQVLYGYDER
jgi:hypothetical protein